MADLNERDAQALKELKALLEVPDALRQITNEHACGGGLHPSKEGFDQAVCDGFEHSDADPRHFVIHAVVGIEGPDEDGYVRAITAEGDWRYGSPVAVLKALRQTVE